VDHVVDRDRCHQKRAHKREISEYSCASATPHHNKERSCEEQEAVQPPVASIQPIGAQKSAETHGRIRPSAPTANPPMTMFCQVVLVNFVAAET